MTVLDAPGVALAVHAGVVLRDVDAGGTRVVTELGAWVARPAAGPVGLMLEHGVGQFPVPALLPRTLRGERRNAREREAQRELVEPPAQAPGPDQLVTNRGELEDGELAAV